jgi:hypothetical protein
MKGEVSAVEYQTTTNESHGYAALGTRLALTLIGAGGLILGAFLQGLGSMACVSMTIRSLRITTFERSNNFLMTVGFAAIVLGLIALLGMAFGTGWLTRIAGAVGIVGFVLFAIQLYRASGDHTIGSGGWISLAGAVVALVAGFFGTRPRSDTTVSPPASKTVIT